MNGQGGKRAGTYHSNETQPKRPRTSTINENPNTSKQLKIINLKFSQKFEKF